MAELGKEEMEFAVALEKQSFVQSAFEHHGGSHVPIGKDLPAIGVLFSAERIHYRFEFLVTGRPELADDEIARLAHGCFAAQIIKLY